MDLTLFNALLKRLEDRASEAGQGKRYAENLAAVERQLRTLRGNIDVARRDLTEAKNKVEQWEKWHADLIKDKTKAFLNVIQKPPGPLDDIPF